MKKMVFLHVLIFISVVTSGLYSSNSPVIKLTQDNFETEVLKSPDLWIVEFFAPWCGHCKNLAPEYEKAAKSLKGIRLYILYMLIQSLLILNIFYLFQYQFKALNYIW